ncbi:MAG: type II toxin-antitoxin system RelE/ParE family toxin [Sulfurovum sp.]|nr:type II toxin-antitoxin system RelE/ParE family toxin [Sulfurovum sp.]
MTIVRSQNYTNALQEVIRFISLDSKTRALAFKHQLDTPINNLDNMPFKFRKSIYFDNDNIRDLIFKGYTVVYKIDMKKNTITIVGLRNTQEKLS